MTKKTELQKYFLNVKREINNIKKYATDEQKSKLDFATLVPIYETACIYGQMCHSCYSFAATELVKKCSVDKYIFTDVYGTTKTLNNSTTRRQGKICTYLEHCIVRFPQFNASIIAYIKDEIKTLKFDIENL